MTATPSHPVPSNPDSFGSSEVLAATGMPQQMNGGEPSITPESVRTAPLNNPAAILKLEPSPHSETTPEQVSRLSPEMQAFVRTPDFKKWFGDWENDPDSASKMVDENGEPALVYFGGAAGIKQLSGDQRTRTGADELGFYFTTRKSNARFYAEALRDPRTDEPLPSSVYGAFLNIRHPYVKQPGDGVRTERIIEVPEGYDGFVSKGGRYEVVAIAPDQIALVQEEPVNVPGQFSSPLAS